MQSFADFLSARLEAGGFTTEDTLATFLPLARQAAAVHQSGKVAPLAGVGDLRVEGLRAYFEAARAPMPVLRSDLLRSYERRPTGAIEVVGQFRLDVDADHGEDTATDLRIGTRGTPFDAPVYLPGYVSWEQELGHHDPLADIFVLGLILASLACGLDLHQPDEMTRFVQHRRNLFEVAPKLHPVLAKAIVRMTELDRHRRPQDLAGLLEALENYREQDIDLELDLARAPEWKTADRPSRRNLILTALRRRLFDVTRRNRLLHFRATHQTVNLTWASVPLVFDVSAIRPEELLTWNEKFRRAVVSGEPIALNRWLRFEEAIYLPGQLDAIRAEAYRDQAEYGFAQLRLVACFLRWTNLKESPPDRYESPLVLVPVRLVKTKGVRDVYTLEPLSSEAEINPALRHVLQVLYGVELPERIDLEADSLDRLYEFLRSRVQASEPGVTLEKIDRPRINLLHAQAQRRLDQYRRRARLSGRGVRSLFDLDYCYDRDNYHPLGLRLFQTRLTPTEPNLRMFAGERPRPRSHVTPPAAPESRERMLYSRAEEDRNPYGWEFDLCSVTLGNFHYRKMSLVRDYEALIAGGADSAPFDALFSLDPRPAATAAPPETPRGERFPIVASDSTQTSAIALARTGRHFIIQGPPGTGKSQTITNLIADHVARGKRVLFICEKRAALDVVYHRLRQAGLDVLACLIHDSQDDKKGFIHDLKQTYEGFLESRDGPAGRAQKKRSEVVARMEAELAPLEHVHRFLQSVSTTAGMTLRDLLDRAIALETEVPELTPRERERLPDYGLWEAHRERLTRLEKLTHDLATDAPLARHPLRSLQGRFATTERPVERIEASLKALDGLLGDVERGLEGVEDEARQGIAQVAVLVAHAERLAPLADHDVLGVLEAKSPLSKTLAQHRRAVKSAGAKLEEARTKTTAWREKLGSGETEQAIALVERIGGSLLRFLSPAWWRLRGVLRRSYDSAAHPAGLSWPRILKALKAEHEAAARLAEVEATARAELGFEGSFAHFEDALTEMRQAAEQLPAPLRKLYQKLVCTPEGKETVLRLARLRPTVEELRRRVGELLEVPADVTLDELRDELALVEESLDDWPEFQPCLRELAALPAPLALAYRRLPWRSVQIEAAVARRTAEDLLRTDPDVRRFGPAVAERQAERVQQHYGEWLQANAAALLEGVRERFLEHIRLAGLPHAELTPEQKEWKPRYNRGRRELEHEFGKTMRYRSIRDLVGDETGLVVRDLKPVWLMSPLSVSDTLPLGETPFDVVIFDEASQVTLEEAVPALYRAQQVLIVGDEKQLPPTSFFAVRSEEDADRELLDGGERPGGDHDLGSDSLLNHAARKLPATMLRWHYRSRSESLIAFSNASFYQGRLLTVPEVRPTPADVVPIVVREPADADGHVEHLLDRPVSFHFVEKGTYRQRRNPAEADAIARLVRGLLRSEAGLSLGVIAFSEAQQGEIEAALDRLAAEDEDFRGRLEAEREREVDGQFVGLLVKNLENIQGDERDVILLSVCYGPGPDGRMLMNFGPINQTGGERRLNVAFSRAKKHMALVSSIRAAQVTNDYNDGARALKNYLRYAEALSTGDLAAGRRVLREANPAGPGAEREPAPSAFTMALAAALRMRGRLTDADVGASEFRVDLGLRNAEEPGYALGILVDDEPHYRNADALERDVLRPSLLRHFGWRVARCFAKNWFDSPAGVLAELEGGPTSKSSTAEATPVETEPVASAATRYFELVEGASNKFWQIEVNGKTHTVRFGRIGAAGQSKTKSFADADGAQRDAERLVREKLGKGYIEGGKKNE